MTPLENAAIVVVCLIVIIVPSVTVLILRDLVKRHFRLRKQAKEHLRGFEVRLPPE